MTNKTWRVGVAGLGTVGGGLLQFLAERPGFAPAGDSAVVTAVSARSKSRPRTVDISGLTWFDDPVALAGSPDIDLFVELVGGSDGPAKAAVETALKAGKPVVTANKALIAEHGAELAALAEAQGVPLLFEAAVMGGVPAVKIMREAMVGDDIDSVAGILNGTCNFILSEMEKTGRSFADVLREAQALGYAEADPTMDVGGFDAGHKISILAALAFGCAPNFAAAEIEGISERRTAGHQAGQGSGLPHQAGRLGRAHRHGVAVKVHPSLAPLDHPLAQAGGALNALFIEGPRRPDLRAGSGRGRGSDRRRRGRRHRRCDDRRRAPGVPGSGRRPEAVHRGRSQPRPWARPICGSWSATSRAPSPPSPKPWPNAACRSTASCKSPSKERAACRSCSLPTRRRNPICWMRLHASKSCRPC
jgi:homoserine dehydrogenase